MYQAIAKRPSTRKIYADRLIAQGDLTEGDAQQRMDDFYAKLDKDFEEAKTYETKQPDWLQGVWQGISLPKEKNGKRHADTAVEIDQLKAIGQQIVAVPNSLNMHRTLKRIIKARADKIEKGRDIDWGLAEHLAFGTLITEGHPVRLSGQDSERGTFSQRQSNWIDQKTEEKYCPLNNLSEAKEYYQVLNSHLSEEAVLGAPCANDLGGTIRRFCQWRAGYGRSVH
jgi:2-oxoglutarate dehydrogenase E1 component